MAKNDYLESGEEIQRKTNEEFEDITSIEGNSQYDLVVKEVFEYECEKNKNN